MVRFLHLTLLIVCILPVVAFAQQPPSSGAPQSELDAALSSARQHLRKGESCFLSKDLECARREFDRAIDSILEIGVDVRADQRLNMALREMIEKINGYQLAALNDATIAGWPTQEYEGRPARVIASSDGEEEFEYLGGPLSPDLFQRQFAELRRRFREKYNRDIVLTGADHGEHRRLYGKGSAYDIRARDLNREQVNFIIATGRKLGLRIKDFSTWEKVSTHNSRVIALGRPLDTLATGLHLHIDRLGSKPKQPTSVKPVIKKEKRKAVATAQDK